MKCWGEYREKILELYECQISSFANERDLIKVYKNLLKEI